MGDRRGWGVVGGDRRRGRRGWEIGEDGGELGGDGDRRGWGIGGDGGVTSQTVTIDAKCNINPKCNF